jgi:hypothetical protein
MLIEYWKNQKTKKVSKIFKNKIQNAYFKNDKYNKINN